MAVDLATSINLARNARVFVSSEPDPDPCKHNILNTFEVNVLADYSFSQDSNSETISLNEAGCSINRGSQTFNTDLAPVDLSLTVYIRPYVDVNGRQRAVEEFLLNGMISQYEEIYNTVDDDGNKDGAIIPMQQQQANNAPALISDEAVKQTIDISKSNVGELLPMQFYFKLDNVVYLVSDVQMETMDIAFDIESIAQMSFSGLGKAITQVDTDLVEAWTGDLNYVPVASSLAPKNGDSNKPKEAYYLNNKLSDVRLLAKSGAHKGTYYSIPITGGSISFTNNISFLVPEELSVVSKPVFGTTGSREITGELTAYLRSEGTSGSISDPKFSGDLLNDLANDVEAVSNEYALIISIAGCNCRTPRLDLVIAHASITVPTIQTEDILSTNIAFTAQGATITTADEIQFIYYSSGEASEPGFEEACTTLPVSATDLVGPIPIEAVWDVGSDAVIVYFDKDINCGGLGALPADKLMCLQSPLPGEELDSSKSPTCSGNALTVPALVVSKLDGDLISYFGTDELIGTTVDNIPVQPFTLKIGYDVLEVKFDSTNPILGITQADGTSVTIQSSTHFLITPPFDAPTEYKLSSNAPNWLVIDSSTGAITGTADTGFFERVTVTGSTVDSSDKSNEFTINIT